MGDELWYKDAIIYQTHVRAFFDSDDNGIGDITGLTSKLDYLKDLGITAIWILPIYPSPLKDDGYDIADYYNVHSQYGTLEDLKVFISESHKRGIRVITELVMNHTSDQHPWFVRAINSPPGSSERGFYVWSDDPKKYRQARVIFRDFEPTNWTWNKAANAYYWHRFYHHQPDLNFDNPEVRKAMFDIIDFWFKLGVDGLRLDAIPYLYERENTNGENLPETHAYLKELRTHVDENFKCKMFLAEANQWPTDAVAYFGNGDECHTAFHFPLMPRMYMAIQTEDNFPIVDIMNQTPKIPDNCQWALFLRNHDELTLEMVTDEERDNMYKAYAKDKHARINLGIRRRLAPLLGNDRRKIELMNVLLMTLPGTPVIYYGDEIGMGDNIELGDRNGVRTPMQWSSDTNAGFSKANPQNLYLPVVHDPEYHYWSVNVENQIKNQSSLFWWMKKLIRMRKQFTAFGCGKIRFLAPDNDSILVFVREYENEHVLVAVNLSKQPQIAHLDLSGYVGDTPEEIIGGIKFPPVEDKKYTLSFTPYGYYVFMLGDHAPPKAEQAEILLSESGLDELLEGPGKDKIEHTVLPEYLINSKWFRGRNKPIEYMKVRDVFPVGKKMNIMVVEINYKDGAQEMYMVPMTHDYGEKAEKIIKEYPHAVIAKTNVSGRPGALYDGIYSKDFDKIILDIISGSKVLHGTEGTITGKPTEGFGTTNGIELETKVLDTHKGNTIILFQDKFVIKIFRYLEEGVNPEVEIGDMLTKKSFPNTAPFLGDIKYTASGGPVIVATLTKFIHNKGLSKDLFSKKLYSYFENVLKDRTDVQATSLLEMAIHGIPKHLEDLVGVSQIENVRLLGKKTGEFHLNLVAENEDFEAVPFDYLTQISTSVSMISNMEKTFRLASRSKEQYEKELNDIINSRKLITERFKALRSMPIDALSTRIHGHYYLEHVLYTGDDFVIIGLEGDSNKPISQRQFKKSPLRDVVTMLMSFYYTAQECLYSMGEGEDFTYLENHADLWHKCISGAFLKSYLNTVERSGMLPKDRESLTILFNAILLDQAMNDITYNLKTKSKFLIVPIKTIRNIITAP